MIMIDVSKLIVGQKYLIHAEDFLEQEYRTTITLKGVDVKNNTVFYVLHDDDDFVSTLYMVKTSQIISITLIAEPEEKPDFSAWLAQRNNIIDDLIKQLEELKS